MNEKIPITSKQQTTRCDVRCAIELIFVRSYYYFTIWLSARSNVQTQRTCVGFCAGACSLVLIDGGAQCHNIWSDAMYSRWPQKEGQWTIIKLLFELVRKQHQHTAAALHIGCIGVGIDRNKIEKWKQINVATNVLHVFGGARENIV